MAIETAIVAPALLTLALGGFEVSTIVSRQTELQSTAAEAAAIVRAALPETAEERTAIRDVLVDSADLSTEQVSVFPVYRCGTSENYANSDASCGEGVAVSEYIRVVLVDSYTPIWTEFGMGTSLNFRVSKTIQVG